MYYDYDIFNGNSPSDLFGHALVVPFDSCPLTRLIHHLQ